VSVEFERADNSVIVVGNGNTAIHVTIDGTSGYSARSVSEPLHPRPLAVINARTGTAPVGRDGLVTAATDALLAGRSVELCGNAGVGKSAIAEAVARRLAARGEPGILLGGGLRTKLDELYTELAGVFFSTAWYTPDEAVMRAETARHRPAGVVIVPDCALSAPDADRLLGTFPDCRFLLCTRKQILYSGPTVLDVPALSYEDALELVAALLDRPLQGFEEPQVRKIHELGRGQVARLVVCAAFLHRAVADPRQHPTVPLEHRDQVSVLVTGLAEPARRVLVALAGFGPAQAALLDALTGLSGAATAAPALEHAGLVVDRGGALDLADDDVRGVLAEHGSWRADPRIAANGLQPLLKSAAAHPRPAPALCVAVAEALMKVGDRDRAFSFARAAAPAALLAGRVGAWSTLVTVGLRSADADRHGADVAYFLGERQTQALLRRDLVAAAAAFTALAAALGRSTPPPAPAPALGPGRGIRALHHTLKARHGAVFATAAVAVAGIVATGAVAGAALGSATVARSAVRNDPQPTTTSSPTLAAAAYPYAVADRSYITTKSGVDGYFFQADIPSVSGVSNSAIAQKINAELRAPVDQDAQQFGAKNSGVTSGSSDEPGFYYITTSIYQVGSLISVQYAGSYHANGQGDVGYTTQTLTIRTDTGAEIPDSALLAPAAVDTVAAALQADRSVSGCEIVDGGETLIAQALSAGAYAINVVTGGLLFTFPAGQIGALGCKPAAVLPWSELNGVVSPEIEKLAGVSTGSTPTATATPTSTGAPMPSTSPVLASTPPLTPAEVVEEYYAAVNARDYRKAWDLGGSSLSPTYQSLVNGYAQVEQDDLTIDSENGDSVSVSLTANLFDGNSERYVGSYIVSHGVIVSGTLALIS
jgi:hypothetical protein